MVKNYDDKFKDIRNIPLNRRGTLRSLSCASGIPKTTLFRKLKERKLLKRVSSTVKPLLTDRNKIDRLKFCLSYVKPDGCFENFFNHVHIDEKWFYLSNVKRN